MWTSVSPCRYTPSGPGPAAAPATPAPATPATPAPAAPAATSPAAPTASTTRCSQTAPGNATPSRVHWYVGAPPGAAPALGPARYCSPSHRMPYNSINDASNCHRMLHLIWAIRVRTASSDVASNICQALPRCVTNVRR